MSSTYLVTGANKGIGYEAVKILSQRRPDARIFLGSRTLSNGQDAIKKMKDSASESGSTHGFSNISVVQIDVTSSSSINAAVEHIRAACGTLDVLLQNSGIMHLDNDWVSEAIFDVNVRGAHDAIEAFTPIMTPEIGTIVLVSSMAGAWYMKAASEETRATLGDISKVTWAGVEEWMKDFNHFAQGSKDTAVNWIPLDQGLYAGKYSVSKALLNAWFRAYASSNPQVKMAAVCPGYCATDLNGHSGPRPASVGGESVVWPILNDFEQGEFYQDGKTLGYTSELSMKEITQMSGGEM